MGRYSLVLVKMQTSLPSKPPEPALKFEFHEKARPAAMPGGLFYVLVNGRKLCDYQHWAFHSCGVATFSNFMSYNYPDPEGKGKFVVPANSSYHPTGTREQTNIEILEEHHEAMFAWLKGASPDQWTPKEFLMVLSHPQLPGLKKMLSHPCVKEIDHFLNKSHGPCTLHLYRISIMKDFPKS